MLTDVALMLADGAEAIADIDVLRHQSGVLGPVASPPTVWRSLDEVTHPRSAEEDSEGAGRGSAATSGANSLRCAGQPGRREELGRVQRTVPPVLAGSGRVDRQAETTVN